MSKTLENEFQLILQGQEHEVDAKVLAETITNFDTLINELNEELKPEYPIKLRVKTFEEGSFEILFALFADPTINSTLFSVLSKENLAIAGNIISTLADLISIKQFLGGDKPKSLENTGDNQIKIENNKGEIKVVNNKTGDIMFNNPTINITINNTFNSLKDEKQITGLSFVSDLNTKPLEIPKTVFEEICKTEFNLLEPVLTTKTPEVSRILPKSNVPLSIFKIVFDDKYKWQFLDSDGQKISATIKDKNFFEKVKKRELYFTNGDVLIADIEIEQNYNEIAKAYENNSFAVIEIKDVKHQPTQTKIDL